MSISVSVRKGLCSAIKKFRFEELESCVVPNFPEITWHEIRSRLLKHKQSFTVTNALRIVEDKIYEANISDKVLRERLAALEIIDISRHFKKKVWYTFVLKGRVDEGVILLPENEMRSTISDNFQTYQMAMDVKVLTHEKITFISLNDKPKSKTGQRRMAPLYFAIFLDHEYLFCSKKNVPKGIVQVLVNALSFQSAKKVKLMGRDLQSLIKMLWIKKQGVVSCEELDETPEFQEAAPVHTKSGTDFRQNKQRGEYIGRCLGNEPPTLELLVATAPERSLIPLDGDTDTQLPEDKFQLGWEFRSHNIAVMLKKLAENRVFTMPVPQYVSNLMKTGKNELTLRENS